MSRRFAVISLLVFVLALLVGGTVLADGHLTRYDDTKSAVELEGGGPSLICNGAFDPMYWGDSVANLAQCWTGYDSDASGWVSHYANINMADVRDTADMPGMDDALGMFVRNVGGDGPHFMYATNELSDITHAGDYWVQVHGTMWGEFGWWMAGPNSAFVQEGTVANSVAFYAISSEADATMVDSSEWRELYITDYTTPFEPGVVPCPNGLESCAQMGRYERVTIEPGQYLHLAAGMKFNPFNVWTVFEFDDIAISMLEKDAEDLSGITDAGTVDWDMGAAR
ncbi:MAG: hypothetical protein M9928_19035 [Anaerolineae bacterium]|nr:hypothetical protein [Anaerolineae bacterium]MCO5187502.1 hypothetical protein [Anaerolineae bacterium]MCO5191682.1 hypothetical protein [Anaerolineae bacterium]MCO5197156.1 hypothetical protein [Anaerolineae bacterium]MCO5207110.1 hypothetical protein [Anaerolineae bacterium]